MDTACSKKDSPFEPHQPSCHPDLRCVYCSPNPYLVSMGPSMQDTPGAMSLPDYWDADAYSTFSQPAANFLAAPGAAQSWAFATTESAFSLPDFTGTSTSNPPWQETLQNEPVTTIHPSLANTWFPSPVPIHFANPNSVAVATISAIQNLQPAVHGSGDDYISGHTNLPIPLQPFSANNFNPFAYTTPHSSLSQDIFNQGAFNQDAFDQDSSHASQYTSSYSQIPQNKNAQDSSGFASTVNMTHMPQEMDDSVSDFDFGAGSLSSQLSLPTPASAADTIPKLRAAAWQTSRSQEPKAPEKARHNRKRKPKFSPERLKTQKVRKVGACSFCKLLHVSCDHDGPCKRCVNAAQKSCPFAQRFEALTLAERICARDDESAFTARMKIIDYLELKSRDFGPLLTCDKCPTKSFSMKLIHPPEVIGDKVYHFQGLPLTIVVEECFTLGDLLGFFGIQSCSTAQTSISESLFDNSKDILIDKFLADMKEKLAPENTSKCQLCFLQKISRNYQIRPDSLPTMKQLVEWGALDVAQKAREFPNDAESVLDAILHRYVNKAPPGPLTPLVQNVVSMTNLGRYLDSRRPIDQAKFESYKAKGLDLRLFRASAIPMRTRGQFFQQAAKGFESLEKLVLPEIDRLLPAWRDKATIQNPLILGLCVRRLALQYRRTMVRYKQFEKAQETRRKNAQDMYDTMTRHYARVFNGTLSPFHKDWQTAYQNDVLLKDDVLIALFEQFKVAEAYHYQHVLNQADDGVYLAMFAERLNKQLTCPARTLEKVDSTRSNIAAVG